MFLNFSNTLIFDIRKKITIANLFHNWTLFFPRAVAWLHRLDCRQNVFICQLWVCRSAEYGKCRRDIRDNLLVKTLITNDKYQSSNMTYSKIFFTNIPYSKLHQQILCTSQIDRTANAISQIGLLAVNPELGNNYLEKWLITITIRRQFFLSQLLLHKKKITIIIIFFCNYTFNNILNYFLDNNLHIYWE